MSYLAGNRHHDLPGERRTAQQPKQMAGHESPRTTKLYDRTKERDYTERGGANPALTVDPKLHCRSRV